MANITLGELRANNPPKDREEYDLDLRRRHPRGPAGEAGLHTSHRLLRPDGVGEQAPLGDEASFQLPTTGREC